MFSFLWKDRVVSCPQNISYEKKGSCRALMHAVPTKVHMQETKVILSSKSYHFLWKDGVVSCPRNVSYEKKGTCRTLMHVCSYYVRDSCRRQISFVLRLYLPTLQNVAHYAIHARFVMYILLSIVTVLFCIQRRLHRSGGAKRRARGTALPFNDAGWRLSSLNLHTYLHTYTRVSMH